MEAGGIRFVVRVAVGLREKAVAARSGLPAADAAGEGARNPFLPYDDALFVGALSPTHVALFNKFNVLDRHLLIVTRYFEDQETLLTAADWQALWLCLEELGGLAFYNGGPMAGASQPHKHLQLVPLPLAADGPAVPIAPLVEAALVASGIGRCAGLGFRHAVGRLDPRLTGDAAARAADVCYRELLAAVGIAGTAGPGRGNGAGNGALLWQSAPYNLLATREWMLVVARRQEAYEGVSVNGLGFAGSLFVRDEAEARLVASIGPMRLLAEVAAPCA